MQKICSCLERWYSWWSSCAVLVHVNPWMKTRVNLVVRTGVRGREIARNRSTCTPRAMGGTSSRARAHTHAPSPPFFHAILLYAGTSPVFTIFDRPVANREPVLARTRDFRTNRANVHASYLSLWVYLLYTVPHESIWTIIIRLWIFMKIRIYMKTKKVET